MQHHRPLAGAVRRHIFQVKTLRQVVVHLHRPQLPLPPQGVIHEKIQLGAIEGCLPRTLYGIYAQVVHGSANGSFRLVPSLGAANHFGGLGATEAEPRLELPELQILKHREDQIHHLPELLVQLLRGDKKVAVVLGEAPRPCQPPQLPALLIAVDGAKFRQAVGQVPVAAQFCFVDLNVKGAVHGLHHEALLRGAVGIVLRHEREHILPVVLPMTRGAKQIHPGDVGSDHMLIAPLLLLLMEVVLQQAAQLGAPGCPEGQPGANTVIEEKQAQLPAQAPMIPLLCFFPAALVLRQLFRGFKGGTVDTLQLGLGLVPPPVGPGHGLQIHGIGIDLGGVGHVGACAKIPPSIPQVVEGDGLPQVGQNLQLVGLANGFDSPPRLLATHLFTAEG